MSKTKPPPKLTDKQRAFVEHYVVCWNATEAARRAGYSAHTANEQGSRLLANVSVKALIQERLAVLKMTADEVLVRLADMARGDIAQLMDVSGVGFNLDMKKAKEAGLTKLIKRVKQKTTIYSAKSKSDEDREETVLEIELYDAQAALVQIGHILRLYGDRVEQIDLTRLTAAQLERLAKGENVYSVLAAAG